MSYFRNKDFGNQFTEQALAPIDVDDACYLRSVDIIVKSSPFADVIFVGSSTFIRMLHVYNIALVKSVTSSLNSVSFARN